MMISQYWDVKVCFELQNEMPIAFSGMKIQSLVFLLHLLFLFVAQRFQTIFIPTLLLVCPLQYLLLKSAEIMYSSIQVSDVVQVMKQMVMLLSTVVKYHSSCAQKIIFMLIKNRLKWHYQQSTMRIHWVESSFSR